MSDGNCGIIDPSDTDRVMQPYSRRNQEHGTTSLSMNSGTVEKQRLMNAVQATALCGALRTIIDVDSGIGAFYPHLKDKSVDCQDIGYMTLFLNTSEPAISSPRVPV